MAKMALYLKPLVSIAEKTSRMAEYIQPFNTITHGPLRMERSHGQNGTLPTKCVGTLAHSREIVPILRQPRGRQRT